MSKKIFLSLFVTFLVKLVSAQTMVMSYDWPLFQHFFDTKLKVALIGNEQYDNAIKHAVENYWKLTPYEFFDYYALVNKKNTIEWEDENSSYMLPLNWSYFANDLNFTPSIVLPGNTMGYNFWLSILPGSGKNISGLMSHSQYSNICYGPFDSFGNEASIFSAAYRLDLIVKSMNDAIQIVKDKQVKEAPLNVITAVYSEFNKNAPLIKGKVLLVNENALKIPNFKKKMAITEEVLKKYQGEYKIVSQQEIQEAIASHDARYAFLCPAICENKEWFVYDLETSNLVFAFHKNTGMTIESSDILLLNAAINRK